ncbi:MAG: Crp/Fnr family transcriptional regulator [Dongiaceae bacterium]
MRQIASTHNFSRGSLLFEQDQPFDQVLIVTHGHVKLYKLLMDARRQIVGFLAPGDILGGVKRSAAASCTAEALTDVECCGFRRKEFLELLRKYPDLNYAFLFVATDEIEAQNEHITLLGRKNAEERLAAFLLMMAARDKKSGPQSTASMRVPLPMSRGDIGDHLGLTIETVSRTFADFRRRGLITTPSQHDAVVENYPSLFQASGLDKDPMIHIRLGL